MADVQVDADVAVEDAEEKGENPEAAAELGRQLAEAIEAGRPALAEPEDDELDEDVTFVRNGWIRVTIAGQLHKLRRPFLGELRDLETSWEADQELLSQKNQDLRERTDSMMRRAQEIEAEANQDGIEPQRKAELDVEATQLALNASTESRRLIREARSVRAAWWEQAFKILTPPGYDQPDQMPAWMGDLALQRRAIEHWQMVPLGRGG